MFTDGLVHNYFSNDGMVLEEITVITVVCSMLTVLVCAVLYVVLFISKLFT